MYRKFALPLLALAGLLAWQGISSAQGTDDAKAEEIKKWSGFWQTKHDAYTEYWKLTEKDGKWTVDGVFANKNGISVGTYFGADPMLSNGVFSFTREWSKKPPGSYEDSAKATAVLAGEFVQYSLKTTTKTINYTMTKLAKQPEVLPPYAEVIGTWSAGVEGMVEKVDVKFVQGKFVVQMAWFLNGQLWGTAVGVNPGYTPEGKLVFGQKFLKKPKQGWQDLSVMTCTYKGDGKMHMHWQTQSGSTGGRDLHLDPGTGMVVVKNPDNPNPPLPMGTAEAKDFLGSFSGDVDGFKEIWLIEKSDAGIWSVKGSYFKGDEPVGSMVGKNVTFADGKLTFVQDYTKVPAGANWFNGATITMTPAAAGGLSYTWQLGAQTGTPRTMTKGR